MSSDDSDYDYNTEEPINGWGDGAFRSDKDGGTPSRDLGVLGELDKLTQRVQDAEEVVCQIKVFFQTVDRITEDVKALKKQVEAMEKLIFGTQKK